MLRNVNSLGFLVLELLVSIGLLAIVVSAIILQLNPLERARERRDDRLRTDSQTLKTAINAFYEQERRMPWMDDFGSSDVNAGLPWVLARRPEVGVCASQECQTPGELIQKSKLVTTFHTGSTINSMEEDGLYVGKGKGANDKVFVCFLPNSEKERTNFDELYSVDFESGITSRGTPLRCSPQVSWKEGDICHICL